MQDFFLTFHHLQSFPGRCTALILICYTSFKEMLNHVMLPQLAIVFIKLCGSLKVSWIARPKYLDEIKMLAKYLGFVGCGIRCAFEWCQINDWSSIRQSVQSVPYYSLFNFVHFSRGQMLPLTPAWAQWHNRGGGKRGEISPLSDTGAHLRVGLSNTAILHCQHSMKINDLHALEGPRWVCKGQF